MADSPSLKDLAKGTARRRAIPSPRKEQRPLAPVAPTDEAPTATATPAAVDVEPAASSEPPASAARARKAGEALPFDRDLGLEPSAAARAVGLRVRPELDERMSDVVYRLKKEAGLSVSRTLLLEYLIATLPSDDRSVAKLAERLDDFRQLYPRN
jgi:hypothetical protein